MLYLIVFLNFVITFSTNIFFARLLDKSKRILLVLLNLAILMLLGFVFLPLGASWVGSFVCIFCFFSIFALLCIFDYVFLALPNIALCVFFFVAMSCMVSLHNFMFDDVFLHHLLLAFDVIGISYMIRFFWLAFSYKEPFGIGDIIALGALSLIFRVESTILIIFLSSLLALVFVLGKALLDFAKTRAFRLEKRVAFVCFLFVASFIDYVFLDVHFMRILYA